ncbi:MAG: Trm112 family protein [Gammaproteobacteria bacterium WSBS_2016_MAG_OTU1]
MLNREFLQILVCPLCKGALEYRKEQRQLLCRVDRLLFSITEDGIPVLLAEDATPFTEATDSSHHKPKTSTAASSSEEKSDDKDVSDNTKK